MFLTAVLRLCFMFWSWSWDIVVVIIARSINTRGWLPQTHGVSRKILASVVDPVNILILSYLIRMHSMVAIVIRWGRFNSAILLSAFCNPQIIQTSACFETAMWRCVGCLLRFCVLWLELGWVIGLWLGLGYVSVTSVIITYTADEYTGSA